MSSPVKFYNYTRALRSNSEYARRMKLISASIFGEVKRPTSRETMRVVNMMSREPLQLSISFYLQIIQITIVFTEFRSHFKLFLNKIAYFFFILEIQIWSDETSESLTRSGRR